ncbi:hypothetical protein GL4_1684 [Methyloceanibacter caenitepidi]|uniref:Uncharacterized protein n=1 Tax=Methyloceanibacter caenitepidi TaxID=1384459 RepID=A0A0A8K2E6_9HYPH|nr:hypothetical protein GL4_1684 [Methyloceanibacter caenitepidi]
MYAAAVPRDRRHQHRRGQQEPLPQPPSPHDVPQTSLRPRAHLARWYRQALKVQPSQIRCCDSKLQ